MIRSRQSSRGMVTAPHHLASESGLSVLREGGSAVEAMVAAAATIAVVYPHMNSIGGDGFWLIMPPSGEPITIDASGPAGSLATLERYKHHTHIPFRGVDAALTVPGTVDGWRVALEWASHHHPSSHLPLTRLLEDAITYARDGFPVSHSQSDITRQKLDELSNIPGFADTFLIHGRVPKPNDRMKQTALANTLKRLSEAGLDDFYRGDIGRDMARQASSLGLSITLEDIQSYSAQIGTPLKLSHSLGDIYNLAPPTQGIVSELILGICDQLDIQSIEPESADHLHLIVEATKRAFTLRDRYISDPQRMKIDAQTLLEEEFLAKEAASIRRDSAAQWGTEQGPGDTVWLGAIDSEGWAVSFIQSIYHEFGSGVVLSDSGITLQNRGASFSLEPNHLNVLLPGAKPFHTLNPAAASFKDGRRMVYGSMGGDGQPQTQAAIFTRYALFQSDLQQAITAPRWLLGRTWGNSSLSLKIEDRFPETMIDTLKARGHDVELLPSFSEAVGHAGAIVRHPDGILEGASDPRSDGAAAGF